MNFSKNLISNDLNTPGSKYSGIHKKTLKISVNLYKNNDFSSNKNKPKSYYNIYKNSNIKKPSQSENKESSYNSNMHKRNSFVKNSNNLESIVSPSRSTFLNNSKLPKNNNHVQINLNQNTSEIKETLGNDNKKTETIKNSVIPNKILKIPKTKSNKKLNINRQSLSNEKYYQNIKTIFKAALNPKKNPKNNQAIFIKTNEMKNFKNDNLRTLNSMYSSKNIKNVNFILFRI